MKRSIAFILLLLLLAVAGCSQQERARFFGGSATVQLEPGKRLITATWKGEGGSLWLLTRDAPATPPQTYTFRESSSYGVVEGAVKIVEQ